MKRQRRRHNAAWLVNPLHQPVGHHAVFGQHRLLKCSFWLALGWVWLSSRLRFIVGKRQEHVRVARLAGLAPTGEVFAA